jgi:PDZ domain
MSCGDFARMEVFLASQIGNCDDATPCSVTYAHMARGSVVQWTTKNQKACGWISVAVGPVTGTVAESLGLDEPYRRIFGHPEPDSRAAAAGIEQGDVLTRINSSSLQCASDFADIISMMAPGTQICLDTLRDDQTMQLTVTLGSTSCRKSGWMRGRRAIRLTARANLYRNYRPATGQRSA